MKRSLTVLALLLSLVLLVSCGEQTSGAKTYAFQCPNEAPTLFGTWSCGENDIGDITFYEDGSCDFGAEKWNWDAVAAFETNINVYIMDGDFENGERLYFINYFYDGDYFTLQQFTGGEKPELIPGKYYRAGAAHTDTTADGESPYPEMSQYDVLDCYKTIEVTPENFWDYFQWEDWEEDYEQDGKPFYTYEHRKLRVKDPYRCSGTLAVTVDYATDVIYFDVDKNTLAESNYYGQRTGDYSDVFSPWGGYSDDEIFDYVTHEIYYKDDDASCHDGKSTELTKFDVVAVEGTLFTFEIPEQYWYELPSGRKFISVRMEPDIGFFRMSSDGGTNGGSDVTDESIWNPPEDFPMSLYDTMVRYGCSLDSLEPQ